MKIEQPENEFARAPNVTFVSRDSDAPASDAAAAGVPATVADAVSEAEDASSGTFSCDEVTCVARLPSGAAIVHTTDPEEARAACSFAGVIVLDNATVPLTCADPAVAVFAQVAENASNLK